MRFAFQNIHGISLVTDQQVMPKTATIGALQIDIAALTETNIHWGTMNEIEPKTKCLILFLWVWDQEFQQSEVFWFGLGLKMGEAQSRGSAFRPLGLD